MPEEGSGLAPGYQGRGAATILGGDEPSPLGILQRKKALAQVDKEKELSSSQSAIGQLGGAWDRDIPNLASKRGAYIKLNSHWMQQGADPRDPSNADVYSQNREVYGNLQDTFKASAQHKVVYDKTREILAKDKTNKYDREVTEASLEQWAALPVEERMGTPLPVPVLREEKFSVSQLLADSSEAINTQTFQQKPRRGPDGTTIFPSRTEPQEGWQDFAQSVYLDNYDNIVKEDPSLDGAKGYEKFLGKYKGLLKTEDKIQIKQKPQIPAWQRKGQGKKEAFTLMQDRIAKAQVGDTRTLQEMIGLKYAGNTIKNVGFNTRTGTIEISTEDDAGNLFPMQIDVNNPESFGQVLNIYTQGKMSEEDMVEFKKIPQHSGYEYDDKSELINTKVDELIAGGEGSAPFNELKGKRFKLIREGIQYDGVIDEVETKWGRTDYGFTSDNSIVFKLTNGMEVPIKVTDKSAFWDVYENTGLIRRQALKRRGQKDSQTEKGAASTVVPRDKSR